MEFHFRAGASLHLDLQRFTVSSGGPVSTVGHRSRSIRERNRFEIMVLSGAVTRRFSAAVKMQHIFAGVTLRICHPRSVFSPSTYGGAGAHLSALQGFEMKITASI